MTIAAAIASAFLPHLAYSQDIPGLNGTPTAEVELWRMQCGKDFLLPKAMFSDTFLYDDNSEKDFTSSCYLLRHSTEYMVWDAGLPQADGPRILTQLSKLGLKSESIRYLGISHYHFDHIGQAADLGGATLLIGSDDLPVIR